MKSAFVQPGSPWQGKCQLCSSDTICERGLRESYDRETQRRSSTEKPEPGQRCYWVEVANKTVCWFSSQHQLTETGLSQTVDLSLRRLSEEHGHKLTCLQLLLQSSRV